MPVDRPNLVELAVDLAADDHREVLSAPGSEGVRV